MIEPFCGLVMAGDLATGQQEPLGKGAPNNALDDLATCQAWWVPSFNSIILF